MLSEDFSSESPFVGNLDVIYALLYWLEHAHSPPLTSARAEVALKGLSFDTS